ncbi:MAG: SRPBCC family protein [Sphingomicrobium sp.]
MTEATAIGAPITRAGPDSIRLERLLDAPPATVWRYLTESDLRRQWFMGGSDATAGGEFEMIIDHDQLSDDDVPYPESYAGAKGRRWIEKVIRFDPPRLLETTFGADKGIVTYELHPEGEGTRLVLTHSAISSPTGSQDFGAGWTSHLALLAEKLAGRGVKDFWALHARSKAAVAEALG